METKCGDVHIEWGAKERQEQSPDGGESKHTTIAPPKSSTETQDSNSDDKKDWKKVGYVGKMELTEDEKLLQRAVAFAYQVILHQLNEFVQRYAASFRIEAIDKEKQEHRLEWTNIHKEYEKLMERDLERFCQEEDLRDSTELYQRIQRASQRTERGQKLVKMLLNTADYGRFVRWMKRRVAKLVQENHDFPIDDDDDDDDDNRQCKTSVLVLNQRREMEEKG